jgi:hypothetical protein
VCFKAFRTTIFYTPEFLCCGNVLKTLHQHHHGSNDFFDVTNQLLSFKCYFIVGRNQGEMYVVYSRLSTKKDGKFILCFLFEKLFFLDKTKRKRKKTNPYVDVDLMYRTEREYIRFHDVTHWGFNFVDGISSIQCPEFLNSLPFNLGNSWNQLHSVSKIPGVSLQIS